MISILKLKWSQVIILKAIKGTTSVEVYSCNVQVTETLEMQKDPKAMLLKDWMTAQSQGPVLKEN